MTIDAPERTSPFVKGRIVSVGADTDAYHRTTGDVPRGHPDRIMSRSELANFAACPRKWIRGIPEQESDALAFGSLMDCAILTPNELSNRYVRQPEFSTATKSMECVRSGEVAAGDQIPWNPLCKEAKDWKREQESHGLSVMTAKDHAAMTTAMGRLSECQQISVCLKCSQRQVFVMAEYHDQTTGLRVPLKCLIDLVPHLEHPFFGKCLADYKTARTALLRPWTMSVLEHGYDCQAALYLSCWKAATGEDRQQWLHIVQENVPPFEPSPDMLSTEFVMVGYEKVIAALRFYCKCLNEGQWPSYGNMGAAIGGWRLVKPPDWAISGMPVYEPRWAQPDDKTEEAPEEERLDVLS